MSNIKTHAMRVAAVLAAAVMVGPVALVEARGPGPGELGYHPGLASSSSPQPNRGATGVRAAPDAVPAREGPGSSAHEALGRQSAASPVQCPCNAGLPDGPGGALLPAVRPQSLASSVQCPCNAGLPDGPGGVLPQAARLQATPEGLGTTDSALAGASKAPPAGSFHWADAGAGAGAAAAIGLLAAAAAAGLRQRRMPSHLPS
jgi:hypothetical protein